MTWWYIIGIIMFVLQVYILKHTHFVEVDGSRWADSLESELQPVKIPLAVILGMLVLTMIPYAWIVSTIIFWAYWMHKYCDPEDLYRFNTYTYWRLRDNFLMKSI